MAATYGSDDRPLAAPVPAAFMLSSVIGPACRSRTNTSLELFASPLTRSFAVLLNEAKRPFWSTDGSLDSPCPLAVRPWLMLSSVVEPVCVSRRKTSSLLFVSSGVRSLAALRKTTNRPVVLSDDAVDAWFPGPVPAWFTLISVVVFELMSRRNTSVLLLVSLPTKFDASLWNDTKCPSALIDGSKLVPLPGEVAPLIALTSTTCPLVRS